MTGTQAASGKQISQYSVWSPSEEMLRDSQNDFKLSILGPLENRIDRNGSVEKICQSWEGKKIIGF